MSRFRSIVLMVLFAQIFLSATAHARSWNVVDFGAVGDGVKTNTVSIQRAIDSAAVRGDTVWIPKGIFVSGTLFLRSGITLYISEGATLKGSPKFEDYPVNAVQYKNAFTHSPNGTLFTSRAFLFAEDVHDIALAGKGNINGSGDAADFNLGNDSENPKSKLRPCMLLFIHCQNIRVYDLHLSNSAYWLQNYIGCNNLHLRGLSIYNHTNFNQDGIDIDAQNVLVEDCNIDVDDDGICFKSHERKNIVENVIVRNCTIGSNCNAIKFGTVSMGGFKNVDISNCIVHKASEDNIRHWQKNLRFIGQSITVLSGIALESVDGADIDNIRIRNIKMNDMQTPIFIVLGNKSRLPVGDTSYRKGKIRNITIQDITAVSQSKMASSITAYPGNYVENIRLENIHITGMGMGTVAEANAFFPENEKAYPENRMYGLAYPASGFYLRHVKNISIDGLYLSVKNKDLRPAIVLDDVSKATISKLNATQTSPEMGVVRLSKSNAITISNPIVENKKGSFVELVQTPEKELSMKRFKTYPNWLNKQHEAIALIDKNFYIFLLAGQSNMAGRGFVDDSSKLTNDSIFMLNKNNEWVLATDPVHFDKKEAGVGPAISFARALLKSNPNIKIGLVPSAVGGSSIRFWQPDSTYIGWHPYDDAIARVKNAQNYGTLKGVLWHQGESDDSPKGSARYMQQLSELIARFRKEFQTPNLPFVAGELGYFHPPYINDILKNVPTKIPFSAVVNSAGLIANPDKIHFTTSSARELGRRYAQSMDGMLDKK